VPGGGQNRPAALVGGQAERFDDHARGRLVKIH
jgi:hypothetical protein